MEERLRQLGDPSGQQTSKFWDEWFEIVSVENHRPYEWYCGVEEVARVLNFHVERENANCGRMVHPGSGNSLVPIDLRDKYGYRHQHTVIDISSVALNEMKQIHDTNSSSVNPILYRACDVLDPPMPFDPSSYDAWIDKGLVDALFCDSETTSAEKASSLFQECHRILCVGGIALVVTMGEPHSLQLVIDNLSGSSKWDPCLHIWELTPLSGDMRPFAIVAEKANENSGAVRCLRWHAMDGQAQEVTLSEEEGFLDVASNLVSTARASFKAQKAQENQDLHFLVLEIKPTDTAVNMDHLIEAVREGEWEKVDCEGNRTPLRPIWPTKPESATVQPVAFGISKLVIECVIPSGDIDHLIEAMQDWDGEDRIEDGIQSVDVDWERSFPIQNLPSFPR